MAGSIILFSSLGNLWGAGMSRAYATETGEKGWIIPTAMQFIPALLLAILVPFTTQSPRWLLLKGRKEEATASLTQIRSDEDENSGTVDAEINALEQLIQQSMEQESGSWLDLFRGNYLRRTWIAASLFIFEQTNGNQFVQAYGATFYVQEGLGSMSFTYAVLGQVCGVVGCAFGVWLMDKAGRRPTFIYGSLINTFFLYLAAGLALDKTPSQASVHTIVACFILVPVFTRISASNCSFLTGAEIGGVGMRKKTMAFGTAMDVAAAFLVTFVTPYILPSLGVNIGWIFGSVSALCVVWGALFFPELKVSLFTSIFAYVFRAALSKKWTSCSLPISNPGNSPNIRVLVSDLCSTPWSTTRLRETSRLRGTKRSRSRRRCFGMPAILNASWSHCP